MQKLSIVSRFDHYLEQRTLADSGKVVTVSHNLKNLLDPYERFSSKFSIIPNGFDPDEVQINHLPNSNPEKFIIAYAGRISPLHFSDNLWSAIEKFYQENETFRNKLEIWMIGKFTNEFKTRISRFDFSSTIRYTGYLDHKETMTRLSSADLLLLIIANTSDNAGILSSKLFNYLATRKYILGIGPSTGEAAGILRQTGAGAMYDYETNLNELIPQLFRNLENGIIRQPDESKIKKYSRENQTKELVRIMENLT